jgi:molecular chaperone GrpE
MSQQETIREEEIRDRAKAGEGNVADDAARSETGTVPAAVAEAAGESSSAAENEKGSRAEYEQLKAERDQLADRVARLQAEFENARKRAERERAEYRDYAAASIVEQFLPVLDNFELALKATGTTEQLRSGVELIVKQMEEILRQLQVTPVPTVGEQFDPRQHEALGSVEREDMPDQHVAEEIRRGYKIREKLLRPAMVRVVSNPKQTVE